MINWLKMLIILILLILEIYLKKLTMTLVKLKKNGHGNKYINSQEFIKLTSENFAGRLLIL